MRPFISIFNLKTFIKIKACVTSLYKQKGKMMWTCYILLKKKVTKVGGTHKEKENKEEKVEEEDKI
jgi:hypothetical protein